MSMLIDNFGWLGNEAIHFSGTRLGAVICLGIALFFIYSSNKANAKPVENIAN
jgi:transporter family-2 protein